MSWLTATLDLLAALALALIGYAYLGYPLIARVFVRPRPLAPPDPERDSWPRVSVLVAARNEAAVIERRLRNLLDQDYPPGQLEVLVASDASDDGTDEIVRRFEGSGVRLVRQGERAGKTAAINCIAPLAVGDILVQTDANVSFSRGAVRSLVAAFDDASVGLAIGELVYSNTDNPDVAAGEGLYWRFETWIKKVEAERGLLAVANGGIYALRRALWRRLPPAIAGDAAEPLLAAASGYRTVIAAGAVAYERAAESRGEEFQRKVRIIAQQVACARWLGFSALPRRIAWGYISHKLVRYAVPLLALLAGAAGAASGWAGSMLGVAFAALAAAPFALAPLGLLALPGLPGRLLRIPLYFTVVNAAAVAGVWRGLAGRAPAAWEVPSSTRSPAPGGASRGSRVG
jgi:cellulose synthase/poly-beta-1,6-N-acetylglucosamine synthase-like glycosyltransferase